MEKIASCMKLVEWTVKTNTTLDLADWLTTPHTPLPTGLDSSLRLLTDVLRIYTLRCNHLSVIMQKLIKVAHRSDGMGVY